VHISRLRELGVAAGCNFHSGAVTFPLHSAPIKTPQQRVYVCVRVYMCVCVCDYRRFFLVSVSSGRYVILFCCVSHCRDKLHKVIRADVIQIEGPAAVSVFKFSADSHLPTPPSVPHTHSLSLALSLPVVLSSLIVCKHTVSQSDRQTDRRTDHKRHHFILGSTCTRRSVPVTIAHSVLGPPAWA
jgi:hypothetical protein